MFKKIVILFVLSLSLFGMPKGHQNSIGFGIAYIQNPYIQSTNRVIPIANINYRYNMFYIKGIETGISLNRNISFAIKPQFGGYEIDGLEKRDDTIEGGVKFTQRFATYKLTLSYFKDMLAVHKGDTTTLQLSKSFIFYPWIVIPNISISSDDKKKSDYFYGVGQNGLYQSYSLGRTFDYGAGLVTIYNLNDKWGIQGVYKRVILDKEKQNSPIVDGRSKAFYFVGLSYKF